MLDSLSPTTYSREVIRRREAILKRYPESMALVVMLEALWRIIQDANVSTEQHQWCVEHYRETNIKLRKLINDTW